MLTYQNWPISDDYKTMTANKCLYPNPDPSLHPNLHPSLYESLVKLVAEPPPAGFQVTDFTRIDQMHTGGLAATRQLIDWLPDEASNGLDLGCGLGGTARIIAHTKGCHMTGSDISTDAIQAAQLLNQQIQPPPACQFFVADSVQLPFADHQFDFIISQHAMMPIADKPALLNQMHRVLAPHGKLLMHEIFIAKNCSPDAIQYPTPWATQREDSHLQTWQAWLSLTQQKGWQLERHQNHSQQALAWLAQPRVKTSSESKPYSPATAARFSTQLVLGKQAALMSKNLLENLQMHKIEVHSALLGLG